MGSENVKVVIVDDYADTIEPIALLLEAEGYKVRTASNGDEALSVIDGFHPLCVLMDIKMPGLDGRDLAAALRARFGSDMVLIAMTGWGNPDDRCSPDFSQFDHYLQKPVDIDVLRKILPPL